MLVESRIAELNAEMATGGLTECVVRSVLYIGMPRRGVDERGFETIRRIREAKDGQNRMSIADFKAMIRKQFFMLLIDTEAAVAAIPAMLPTDMEERRKALAHIKQILSAAGEIEGESADRLERISRLFQIETDRTAGPKLKVAVSHKEVKHGAAS
jgi:hypothetical protein